MGRHSKTVIEYRSYEFPPHFPLRVIAGEEWRISDVPSGDCIFTTAWKSAFVKATVEK